jgi:hypothetical protein
MPEGRINKMADLQETKFIGLFESKILNEEIIGET